MKGLIAEPIATFRMSPFRVSVGHAIKASLIPAQPAVCIPFEFLLYGFSKNL